ncbi:MAG TPA: Pycsar system effector family protein [Nakamurella sp.]
MTEDVGARTAAQDLLDRTRSEVSLADNKASILLAGVLAAAGGISAALVAGGWSPVGENRFTALLFWGCVLFLIGTVVCLALVVYPQQVGNPGRSGKVLGYFGDVAALPGPDALRDALAYDRSDHFEVVIDQLWRISRIVARKYGFLQLGMRLLAITFVLGALTAAAAQLT